MAVPTSDNARWFDGSFNHSQTLFNIAASHNPSEHISPLYHLAMARAALISGLNVLPA
jgi:hypothetical protein